MIELHETITGHSRIDFDKKKMRKAMRQAGGLVRKHSRRLIARRALSSAGEYPGRDEGVLMRSIKAKVSRSGFMVRIAPYKIAGMDDFYPAFLEHGTPTMDPRENFMVDALAGEQAPVRSLLRDALADSLIPR